MSAGPAHRLIVRYFFRDDRRAGTLAPLSRASLKPMAIACLRLVTRRPEPLLRLPFLRRRIADSTFLDADLPYFAMLTSTSCHARRVLEPSHAIVRAPS